MKRSTSSRSRSAVRFVAATGFIFLLLIAPWPSGEASYAAGIRRLAALAFQPLEPRWFVRLEAMARTVARPHDTRLIVADRRAARPDGSVPAEIIELDLRGIGYVPTALMLALLASTPMPWRQRTLALLMGIVAVTAFVLFSVTICLLAETEIVTAPAWRSLLAAADYTLIDQMGISFGVPVAIWAALAFGLPSTTPAEFQVLFRRRRES